jgi:tetratricopeptide (TPR) repeat protein
MFQSRSTGPSALESGYAALIQGRLQEAKQAYTQALVGNAEERDALLGLAYIAHQQGRTEEARAYYQRVLRQEPGNPVAKSGLLMLSPTEDMQEFGSQSREIAEQNPDSAVAQSVLGQSLVRQGRLADAQLAFQRTHLLEPGVALHAFNLAVALDRLRNYDQARLYYERALTLSAQSGAERSSGVPLAAVRARLLQLQAATVANPAESHE